MLTAKERERYDRQIMIDEMGEEWQQKLKKAKVFVAGAGGLGSPASMYLATAGVGLIRIVDHDTVNLSNLNRQILHWDKDIGRAGAIKGFEGRVMTIVPGKTACLKWYVSWSCA